MRHIKYFAGINTCHIQFVFISCSFVQQLPYFFSPGLISEKSEHGITIQNIISHSYLEFLLFLNSLNFRSSNFFSSSLYCFISSFKLPSDFRIPINELKYSSFIGRIITPLSVSSKITFTPALIPYLLRIRFGISNCPFVVNTEVSIHFLFLVTNI